jgi:hypothetical protein
MPDFPAAGPHGPLQEVFPDVFFVTGSYGFGPALRISRNMTIVRQARDELVVINSVRLSESGEKELEKLGRVTHVIRTGFFHGIDDPYFKHRFGAKTWAAPRTGDGYEELTAASSPLHAARVFTFDEAKDPEAAIVLDMEGGILVACDSFQNWESFGDCSLLGGLLLRAMGFGPTLVGGPWAKHMGRAVRADFDRLGELPFEHLVPAHGAVLRDRAKDGLRRAVARRFGGKS